MSEKAGMTEIADLGPSGRMVAWNLKRIREKRNLTYAALSKAVGNVGRRIPPLALRRIEAHARRVDVDDLVALAVALNVSPLTLLLPNRGDLEPAPMTATSDELGANVLWLWARGDEPLHLPAEPPSEDSRRAIRLFQLQSVPHIHERTGVVIGEAPATEEDFADHYRRQGIGNAEDTDG